ncbi:MAG: OB-fold nucleic acid binding domain-containing protein, partial [bacterium]
MVGIPEIKKNRLEKIKNIQSHYGSAYPLKTKRTHTCAAALKDFDDIVRSEKEISLVGRIKSLRVHGGSTFFHFADDTGLFQAYLKKDGLGEKFYQFFLDNFDVGDFVEIRGILFKTKREEKTMEVANFKMLSKSLLPLPEKWHGLQDIEERYRKRYLDLIFNEEVKEKFVVRSRIIRAIREFLEKEGFLEVETPV